MRDLPVKKMGVAAPDFNPQYLPTDRGKVCEKRGNSMIRRVKKPAMQSTGTRTVRGLEAITLSTPPTPGNSIVRRPNNSGLFSIGSVFSEHGYDRTFIYGGYGYFDNMNSFFAGNGYRVLDRTDFPPAYKTFATAWGQCDEDLFNVSLAEADASHAAGRPFHQVVLTTSNHRPFTYPEGKVDTLFALLGWEYRSQFFGKNILTMPPDKGRLGFPRINSLAFSIRMA